VPTYTVFLFKNEIQKIPDKYHPDVDKIPYIEYDGDDGNMEIGSISEDETFALKIAGRHWENMKAKIFSDTYESTAEDKIFHVLNEGILKTLFSDRNPYKKILVKKES
jgi:hypothetical protein